MTGPGIGFHLKADTFGQAGGLENGRVGQNDSEFVPAVPEGHVHGPDVGSNDVGHVFQEAVSGGMPVSVVDLLETVQVHHDQRTRGFAAVDSLHFHPQAVLEITDVEQAGQGVGDGQFPEPPDFLGHQSDPFQQVDPLGTQIDLKIHLGENPAQFLSRKFPQ